MSNNNGIASGFFSLRTACAHTYETIASETCNKIQSIFIQHERNNLMLSFTSTALTNIHQTKHPPMHSSAQHKMRKLYKLLRLQACKPFLFIAANWTKKNYLQYYLFLPLAFHHLQWPKIHPKIHPTVLKMWGKQLFFFSRRTRNGAYVYMSDGFALLSWCCCYLALCRHSNQIHDNKSISHINVFVCP